MKIHKVSSLKIVVPQFQFTMIYKHNINILNKSVVLKQTFILSSQHGIFFQNINKKSTQSFNSFPWQWRYLNIYISRKMCFTQLCQCKFKFEMIIGFSSFCLGYFFSIKKLCHVAKVVNTLHLNLGSSQRPNYFPTFTLSKHISHLCN